MTLEKGKASFHAMVELKNSATMELNVANVNTKGGLQNCQMGLTLHTLFL